MAGYPDSWEVPSRNRQYSNQPGGLYVPEQVMVREFTPEDPIADHMRNIANEMRSEPQGFETDFGISNQPLEE